MQSAPLGRRVAAIVIDWVASTGVMIFFLGAGAYFTAEGGFTVLGIFFAEIVILTWILGGSFGQMVVGLRVLAIDGGRLAFWRIAARTALICVVLPAVVMDKQGRGLQDRLVGSIVLSVRPPRAP